MGDALIDHMHRHGVDPTRAAELKNAIAVALLKLGCAEGLGGEDERLIKEAELILRAALAGPPTAEAPDSVPPYFCRVHPLLPRDACPCATAEARRQPAADFKPPGADVKNGAEILTARPTEEG